MKNLILLADSYKLSHPYQFPSGCSYIHNYIESRGGKFESTVFFGYSTTNVAFGQGGGFLQKVNRDTCKFACKCSAVKVNNKLRDVYKSPIGEEFKHSKAGQLDLILILFQVETNYFQI